MKRYFIFDNGTFIDTRFDDYYVDYNFKTKTIKYLGKVCRLIKKTNSYQKAKRVSDKLQKEQ